MTMSSRAASLPGRSKERASAFCEPARGGMLLSLLRRRAGRGAAAALLLGLHAACAGAPDAAPASKPISTDKGPIGDLLRKWAAKGTAAGNADDSYDNRDRGHSMLDLSPYPQLRPIEYSEGDRKASRDWALQNVVHPRIVFGNSSTAADATTGGSNPRSAYASNGGIAFLHTAYRRNNLYIYPAHHDHSLGHNGVATAAWPFYGDLFPANTPYVIVSEGSSGSDQPFMKAVAFTLAAFRPEVKSALASEGMLMPAVQMIFRMCNRKVVKPADYLTGKAHPPVFGGDQVDALKMVQMAHEIDLKHLPPLATLRIVEEDSAESGRDYFEPLLTEALADSPCAIARVHRSTAASRRFVLSADGSTDINHLTLTYHWVLLQGDPEKVKIQRRDKAGSSATITIPYHDRATIAPGDPLESNRVDIGVFVHNGTYFSPPAFFTSFTLDSEARTYDSRGRILEIGYAMGESTIDVADWPALFGALTAKPLSPGARLLTQGLQPEDMAVVVTLAGLYKKVAAGAELLGKIRKDAEAAVQKATPATKAELETAAKQAADAETAALKYRESLLSEKQLRMAEPFKPWAESRLRTLLNDPWFCFRNGPKLDAATYDKEMKRWFAYGIVAMAGQRHMELAPVLPGDKPVADRLTRYQKAMLAQSAGALLAASIPGVRHEFRANVIDSRLSTPGTWRDLYHYGADGTPTGWTRYDGAAASDFTARGQIVETRDAHGRCLTARSVLYGRKSPPNFDPRYGGTGIPLTFSPGSHTFRFEYKNEKDQLGKMIDTTNEPNPPRSSESK